MGKLTQRQAEEIAKIAAAATAALGEEAVLFCEKHDMDTPNSFNATMLTLLDSMMFITLDAMFDTPADRREAADHSHASVTKLLRNHAIHRHVQKMRNPT
jgi:hypothetical protein